MSTPHPSPQPAPLPPPPGTSRAEEDRYLWQAFRHHSRTFSLAARLLRRDVQLPIAVLYLYCRTVDTIADERVLEVGASEALREVEAARTRLEDTLAGRPPEGILWQRMAEIHERFGLLHGPLHELLDGAVWDLEGRTVTDIDDLLTYSGLVAGSVGAMMLPFLVDDRAEIAALEPTARALGEAMQITNILRDVGEDMRRDRCYLPADRMAAHGVSLTDLRDGRVSNAYVALLEELADLADARYRQGWSGIPKLHGMAGLAVGVAALNYEAILRKLRQNRHDNFTRRAFLRPHERLALIPRAAFGVWSGTS